MKKKGLFIVKIILNILGICIFLFGFFGFFISAVTGMGNSDDIFYDEQPLNLKNGIVVDSEGYYYIGAAQSSILQVYDNEGNFQYGFNLPTEGGGFQLGIENDEVYIYMYRTESLYALENNELILVEDDIEEEDELLEEYSMSDGTKFISDNLVYKISLFNKITITDTTSGEVTTFELNAPVWPFNLVVFWIMTAAEIGMIFLLHRKPIVAAFRKAKEQNRKKSKLF